jgi:hypothetical protein
MPVSKESRLAVLLGFAIALFSPVLLSGWASFWICLGLHPESLLTMDVAAPLLGLWLGGWYAGRKSARFWLRGLAVAGGCIAVWFLAWLFLAGRVFPVLILKQGLLGLTVDHLMWWGLAAVVAVFGAWAGELWPSRREFELCVAAVLLAVPGLQFAMGGNREVPASLDGTTIRFISYDLNTVRAGVYDADSDDADPYNDRNTTWYAQPMPLVWRKLARMTRPVCAVNGGFFGADSPYIAHHEAPLVVNGKALYDTNTLARDWPDQAYLLGWRTYGQHLTFELSQNVPFNELPQRYDGALGGVRALRINGQSFGLTPGVGNTGLMTSRTSIGWDDRNVYVLSVRDPDGEAAGIRAKNAKLPQVGGWDVRQVQQFWEQRGIPNAALFDGGESAQLAFAKADGRVEMTHSSYFFTRTPCYIRSRPLRFVWPMLPPFLANGGVLNYFYLSGS